MSVPRLTVDGRRWQLPDKGDVLKSRTEEAIPVSPSLPIEEPRESFFVFSDDPVVIARAERNHARGVYRQRRCFAPLEEGISLRGLSNEDLGVRAWAREWIMNKQSVTTLPRYKGPSFDLQSITVALIVEMWRQQKGICALSGRQMVIPRLRNTGSGAQPPRLKAHIASVDRVNSSLGYQAGNIQLACYMANCMKTNMPIEEFAGWCRDISITLEKFTGIE